MDVNRQIKSFEYFAPEGSPLEKWLDQSEIKKGFERVCLNTQVWICEREEKRQKELQIENSQNDLENESEDVNPEKKKKKPKVVEPDVPIFAFNSKDAENYFPPFHDSLFELEGTKCTRKYQKIDKDTNTVIEEPTKLEIYDYIAESILPRNEYFGPAKGFKPGHVTWRIKLVVRYLMQKNKIDYNNYCKKKPEN